MEQGVPDAEDLAAAPGPGQANRLVVQKCAIRAREVFDLHAAILGDQKLRVLPGNVVDLDWNATGRRASEGVLAGVQGSAGDLPAVKKRHDFQSGRIHAGVYVAEANGGCRARSLAAHDPKTIFVHGQGKDPKRGPGFMKYASLATRSVVVATGDDRERFVRNAAHEPVFLVDAALPAALELMP